MGDTDQFLWIVIVGGYGALIAAVGIGANDVANAFATSVGAKSITLRQAILFAACFEFLGALILGNHVMKTIRNNIAEVECFEDNPGILMYGMCCVVYTTGFWLLLASYLELPVSTTHSTVGAIVGMAMAYRGSNCVDWYTKSDTFPFVKGVSGVVASWVLSPLFSAVLSAVVFSMVRRLVLRSENAFQRALWLYPALICATVSVNVFFITYKGGTGSNIGDISIGEASIFAFGIGIGMGILSFMTVIPHIKRVVNKKFTGEGLEIPEDPPDDSQGDITCEPGLAGFMRQRVDRDLHAVIHESEVVAKIHGRAENFDPRVEEVFRYLQVITAICDSFSHGANDVANATGPFAAIYITYKNGKVTEDEDLQGDSYWILAIGGGGIVLGLTLYGYEIIQAIGVKIAKITPSRGFTIELGAALIIIIGTRLEIPLSTTHCQVGATVGVALLEGARGLNSLVLLKVIIGWVITIVVCGLVCALLFAQGAYAPYVDDVIE